MSKKLHIVSFDIPYPSDYGGVIDVFNTIKHLHQAGVEITLHCFEYGRKQQTELEKYCEAVYYYPRKKIISLTLPYIVSSRKNNLLRQRLIDSEGGILLEGIHCTYYLHNGDLKNNNVWVRLHNVEHEYYRGLFKSSNHPFRKFYYFIESLLLRKYEKILATGNRFLALSETDKEFYEKLGAEDVELLPLFLENAEVNTIPGKGDYCLYHGNLSVTENEVTAIYLIEDIFSNINTPLIIAGRNPTNKLKAVCRKRNIQLIANPLNERLNVLIRNAHINVLPSFNHTGIKVKLLHALLNGRFVVTNDNAVRQEKWSSICTIANSKQDILQSISRLMTQEFTEEMIEERRTMMSENFDPPKNAQWLIQKIFS